MSEYSRPNRWLSAFFLFGKPKWVFPLLAALLLLFVFFHPIGEIATIAYFPAVLLCGFLILHGIIGLFLNRRYWLAAVSLVLLFAILLSGIPLARFYENMRLKILRPQMQSVAEELFSQYEDQLAKSESITIPVKLSLSRRFLSRNGIVLLEPSKTQGFLSYFCHYRSIDATSYFVYQSQPNPNWRTDTAPFDYSGNFGYYIDEHLYFVSIP